MSQAALCSSADHFFQARSASWASALLSAVMSIAVVCLAFAASIKLMPAITSTANPVMMLRFVNYCFAPTALAPTRWASNDIGLSSPAQTTDMVLGELSGPATWLGTQCLRPRALAIAFSQHPDEHRPERPVLLAIRSAIWQASRAKNPLRERGRLTYGGEEPNARHRGERGEACVDLDV